MRMGSRVGKLLIMLALVLFLFGAAAVMYAGAAARRDNSTYPLDPAVYAATEVTP